ncbi:MAG: hypothetical protein ABUS51_08770 [Acidobacteriota bacterium]
MAGIGLAMVISAGTARADQWDKKTILTVNERMQVRDTVLEPGQYVFKLLDSQSDRHVVQIFNYNQTRVIDTELAIPNYRLKPTGDSRFAFWETPAGRAKALRAWFYPGDNFGQEFPYPKQLAMATETASTATIHQEPAPQVAAEVPAPAPEPQAAPVNAAPEPAPQPEPQEIAQNTPPPAPEPVRGAPAVSEPPATLPKTASTYPLIGLSGLLSLGLFGLVRRGAAVKN